MTPRESAVIVAVPEAEPLVGRWRLRHCDDARDGVPAHVTLLYPFVPADELDESVERELATLFATVSPFRIRLTRAERFPGVLYLAPEPLERFGGLIDALRRRFPEYPPYGEPDLVVVPHLTVAYGDEEVLARIAPQLVPGLPIAAGVKAASLIEQDPAGRWHERTRLPLGTSAAGAV